MTQELLVYPIPQTSRLSLKSFSFKKVYRNLLALAHTFSNLNQVMNIRVLSQHFLQRHSYFSFVPALHTNTLTHPSNGKNLKKRKSKENKNPTKPAQI